MLYCSCFGNNASLVGFGKTLLYRDPERVPLGKFAKSRQFLKRVAMLDFIVLFIYFGTVEFDKLKVLKKFWFGLNLTLRTGVRMT